MGRRSARGPHAPTTRSVRVRALLSLGMVLGLGAVGTLAAWTDVTTATATFSAGDVDINVNGSETGAVVFSSAAMKPGDVLVAPVRINNTGDLSVTYRMATAVTGTGLGAGLAVEIRSAATTCQNVTSSGGVVVSTGSTTLTNALIINSRPLAATAPSNTETLCFKVSLPADAPDSYQGKTAETTFTFTAENT
jgi:predicted ribosomally synthesized peptide with SipW-like signal peptide